MKTQRVLAKTKRVPVSKQTAKRRLLSLANFLEKLPEKKFNFSNWFSDRDEEESSCRTTACALGWAVSLPWAKKAGVGVSKCKWGILDSYFNDSLDREKQVVCFTVDGEIQTIKAAGNFGFEHTKVVSRLFGSWVPFQVFLPNHFVEVNGVELRTPDEFATAKEMAEFLREVADTI